MQPAIVSGDIQEKQDKKQIKSNKLPEEENYLAGHSWNLGWEPTKFQGRWTKWCAS